MAISVISDSVSSDFLNTPPKNRIFPQRWANPETHLFRQPDRLGSAVQGMRPAVVAAQFLGLMPFFGAENAKFNLVSFNCLYYFFTLLGFVAQCIFIIARFLDEGEEASNSVHIFVGYRGHLIYMSTVISLHLLYLLLSRNWHNLSDSLHRLERRMEGRGYPAATGTGHMWTMTVFVLLMTLVVEVIVDLTPAFLAVLEQTQFSKLDEFSRNFFLEVWPFMEFFPGYSIGVATWAMWSKMQTKFAVAYVDLLLWLLSRAVAARFWSLNEKLSQSNLEAMTAKNWESVRAIYNEIVELTEEMDRILGPQILICFAGGLWFICGSFLLLSNNNILLVKKVYIFLSLVFWCIRLPLAVISMASVYEQNQCVKNYLHAVPTSACSEEVIRFTMQACHSNLGFTGMHFFVVTRSVLLTLVGTVVSYEVVLMEFNH